MSRHLLLITLGPVQDFIAAARRTRDLWYGSHILSELSRAAARALVQGGATLVFPALAGDHPELEACSAPLRSDRQPPLNVANKLLAEVPDGVDPRHLAKTVRGAVLGFWRSDIAAPVRLTCSRLLADGSEAAWTEQIDGFVEFLATWAPLDTYASARSAVEQAIAARKHLRDFQPWRHLRGAVPKSSLDGARETILRRAPERDAALARKYRIAPAEELDAVGLVKRGGGAPEQFVPIANVALAPWVELARRTVPGPLEALKAACRDARIARVDRPDLPCARPFPFQANILLPNRWKSVFTEQGLDGDPIAWGRLHVGPLLRVLRDPYPYVACLVADGDRMGRAIQALGSAEAHRAFSRDLSDFASEARRIVEQRHRGSLVYAGGDDVLAFLPLPEALPCAEALRHHFAHVMDSGCGRLSLDQRPTLSVGIGVGHLMESMADLLALGREAEQCAKGRGLGPVGRERNALAVVVDKRSGGKRSWRAQWTDWDGDPVARLVRDAALLDEILSVRKVYEIERTLVHLPDPTASPARYWSHILALEVQRSLARVGNGERGVTPEAIGLSLDEQAPYAVLHAEVSALAARMLVARIFAAALPALRRDPQEAVG